MDSDDSNSNDAPPRGNLLVKRRLNDSVDHAKPSVSTIKPTITKQEQKRLKKQRREEKSLKPFKKNEEQQKKNSVINKMNKEKLEKDEMTLAEESEKGQDKGRHYTISIAVAGSIIDNAQSQPLRAYLAGQIARAAAIYNVDEIVVYDDTGGHSKSANQQMARILQFLECPQYLRKSIFPIHSDLQYSGVMSPLDLPHHLRRDEALPYREGVVSNRPVKEGKGDSFVYVGLERDCKVDKQLEEGLRVTVKFSNPDSNYILSKKGKLKGTVVSPHLPRMESGVYWGYSVRVADNLGKVFTQCPFREGYDITVGTSEKGSLISDLKLNKPFKRMLIVFGGVEGLEYALENDETLTEDDVSALFDYYVNTCPTQGSRTIRTEEAILISMAVLSPLIVKCNSSLSSAFVNDGS